METDEGRLGDVFRLTREGFTPQEIADRLDVASIAFVYNNRRQAEAILDGRPVNGPAFRMQTLSVFGSVLKRARTEVSPEALKLLLANRSALEAAEVEENPVREAEAAAAEAVEASATLASLEGVPGIYAFSYGWYLEGPVDPERGNTLIKVGMSVNIAQQIREHTSKARTHIPEPLALIRAYGTGERNATETERFFHELLRTAGHVNPRRVGREIVSVLPQGRVLDEAIEVAPAEMSQSIARNASTVEIVDFASGIWRELAEPYAGRYNDSSAPTRPDLFP